jgi:hypothetical protein
MPSLNCAVYFVNKQDEEEEKKSLRNHEGLNSHDIPVAATS